MLPSIAHRWAASGLLPQNQARLRADRLDGREIAFGRRPGRSERSPGKYKVSV